MKGLVIEVNAQKGNAVCGLRSLQALTQKMLFSFVIRNVAASPVRTPDHHAHPIPLLGVVHTFPQTTSSLCICPILRLVLLTFGDPSLLPISKISLGGVRKYESIGATLSDPIRHPPPLGGSLGRRPCPFCCPFWLVSNSSTLHTYLSFGTRALLIEKRTARLTPPTSSAPPLRVEPGCVCINRYPYPFPRVVGPRWFLVVHTLWYASVQLTAAPQVLLYTLTTAVDRVPDITAEKFFLDSIFNHGIRCWTSACQRSRCSEAHCLCYSS